MLACLVVCLYVLHTQYAAHVDDINVVLQTMYFEDWMMMRRRLSTDQQSLIACIINA